MNVLNKVTLQSLRKNRTRTVVTIIGIILSAAMFCAVTTSVSSMRNYLMQYVIYTNGDWHGKTDKVPFQSYLDLSASSEIASASYGQLLGYAKINSERSDKPYLFVIGGSESFFSMTSVHLTAGELPKNSGQLILPAHLSTMGGVKLHIGDEIILDLGKRMQDGYELGQGDPYCSDTEDTEGKNANREELVTECTRSYTVVGFYERPTYWLEPFEAPGFTALTVADTSFRQDARFDVFFKMKDASRIYDFMREEGLGNQQNTNVLLYSGVSRYSSYTSMLAGLAAIVMGLIMFGSVALIYNAFSISVSERTKQFGLLSSLGATKKQLKKMVLFEALVVSGIGIPIGVLAGVGGIWVTLRIIGQKFATLIGGSFQMPLTICVSWQSLLIAATVALITVFISAWIPSKRATGVTAVEAIRQNADIYASKKTEKMPVLTYKLFGLPGVLAKKYYQRNRKKYRTTVVSLFMSIVLFVSASSFSEYLMESVTGGLQSDQYDLWYSLESDPQETRFKRADALLQLFSNEPSVTACVYAYEGYFDGMISDACLSDQFLENSVYLAGEKTDAADQKHIFGYLYFVNDAEFRRLLSEYHLKEADYFDVNHPLGIALDRNIQFDAQKQKYVTTDTLKGDTCEIFCSEVREIDGYDYIGSVPTENGEYCYRFQSTDNADDILELSEAEAHDTYLLRTGKTVVDAPFYISRSTPTNLKLLYPVSMMASVLPQSHSVLQKFQSNLYMTSDDPKQSYRSLSAQLRDGGWENTTLIDHAETVESQRNIVTIIRVFAYGFIVLISLIAAANVFNTISTNINLRRREFAMLKSVGMSDSGLNRMMNYECILYGSKALLLGIPVSAGITYLIYRSVLEGYETVYRLPLAAMGIAALSVFFVVFATMLYSMKRIKRDNPIEALKNENL